TLRRGEAWRPTLPYRTVRGRRLFQPALCARLRPVAARQFLRTIQGLTSRVRPLFGGPRARSLQRLNLPRVECVRRELPSPPACRDRAPRVESLDPRQAVSHRVEEGPRLPRGPAELPARQTRAPALASQPARSRTSQV